MGLCPYRAFTPLDVLLIHPLMKYTFTCLCLCLLVLVFACGRASKDIEQPQEDTAAKKMLQGVWVNEDEQYVAFRAKGDTIYYPDPTNLPVCFQIINDTLVLHGANVVKYAIIRQTANLFVFVNQNGDEVRLVKSGEKDDANLFTQQKTEPLNQNTLIKRDTVVSFQSDRYHCYVQVNPTTYKVIKTTINDEGVQVDNVYYDNIVNLNVYQGASKLFSSDFRKQQFAKVLPSEVLEQCVLSDLVFSRVGSDGVTYAAVLLIPDSPTSYRVLLTVSPSGKLTMHTH